MVDSGLKNSGKISDKSENASQCMANSLFFKHDIVFKEMTEEETQKQLPTFFKDLEFRLAVKNEIKVHQTMPTFEQVCRAPLMTSEWSSHSRNRL